MPPTWFYCGPFPKRLKFLLALSIAHLTICQHSSTPQWELFIFNGIAGVDPLCAIIIFSYPFAIVNKPVSLIRALFF